VRTLQFYGSANQRQINATAIMRNGGICLTTYGLCYSGSSLVRSSHVLRAGTISKSVSTLAPTGQMWDYVLLDEGHKIKNHKIALSKRLRELPARHRIVVTGTPLQNNLQELWSIFDYIFGGQLLGSLQHFTMHFGSEITRAQVRVDTPLLRHSLLTDCRNATHRRLLAQRAPRKAERCGILSLRTSCDAKRNQCARGLRVGIRVPDVRRSSSGPRLPRIGA
jgi:hypothetical protein